MVEIIFIPVEDYVNKCSKIGRMEKVMQGAVIKYNFKPSNSEIAPKFVDLHLSKQQGLLNPDVRIMEQFEVNFLNKIESKYVVDSFPIYFPDFSKKYNEEFVDRFGINQEIFNEIKVNLRKEKFVEVIECLNQTLEKHFSKKIVLLVSNIMESYKKDGQKVSLTRKIPMINQDINIEMQTMAENKKTPTIHSRFIQNVDEKQGMKHDWKMKPKISIYSDRRSGKFFRDARVK